MNNDYQDKIDRYLLGKMSEAESLDFEKDIINDEDLKEQYKFTKNVKEVIAGRNRRLAEIKEWKEAYEAKNNSEGDSRPTESGLKPSNEIKLEPRTSTRRYMYWISGIAAVFVVGFFIISPIFFEKKGSIDHSIYVSVSSLRSTEDNSGIAKLINDGKYDLALNLIKENDDKLEFDIMQTEQDKDKMDGEEYAYLKKVHKIQKDELNLLKAYALFGLKRSEEAMSILDKIRQSESEFKEKADSLYKILKVRETNE